MTQKSLSERTGLTEKHISKIINGEASVTVETALLLENALGGTASFWINLEKNYQETKARLERRNVSKRAELFNDGEKISYVYLVSYGKVMAFHTAKGKISSLQSYLNPTERLVNGRYEKCSTTYSEYPCYPVEAPEIDGTYGNNPEGIFFFTTEGAYVEWNGEYMVSDQPLRLATPPELVREVE